MTDAQMDGGGTQTVNEFAFTRHSINTVDILWDGKRIWDKPLDLRQTKQLYLQQNEYLTKKKKF